MNKTALLAVGLLLASCGSGGTKSTGSLSTTGSPDAQTATVDMKDDDPDAPAMTVANYALGGGGFVSRLLTRLREKDGLSYFAFSRIQLNPLDEAEYLAWAESLASRVVQLAHDRPGVGVKGGLRHRRNPTQPPTCTASGGEAPGT